MAFGDVSTTYQISYNENVKTAIQQMTAKFEPAFTFHNKLKGETAQVLNLVGATRAIVNGPRGGDTPNIQGLHDQVWVHPDQIDWGRVIEDEDWIKALTDYQSEYVQAGALAVMRDKEQVLANAIFGPKQVGKNGTVIEAYDNTGRLVLETVGSADGATPTGMNVKKIIRALRLLEENEADVEMDEIYLALNPLELEQLYGDITFVNKDYRDQAVLEKRRVMTILGVTIINTTGAGDKRLPNLDSDTHRAAMWLKSGMHWGEFKPLTTKVEANPAKKYRPHPYIETWIGATRGEGQKVIEILNKF